MKNAHVSLILLKPSPAEKHTLLVSSASIPVQKYLFPTGLEMQSAFFHGSSKIIIFPSSKTSVNEGKSEMNVGDLY